MTQLVLVCGSRDWPTPGVIRERIAQLPPDTRVMHGGARGVDQYAAAFARALGLSVEGYPADWEGLGRRAGIVRNLAMLDQQPDLVLAFWHNHSIGTEHVIDEANRRGIPCEVIVPA